MKVLERPELTSLNTFGVAAKAGLMIDIETEEDVLGAPVFDASSDPDPGLAAAISCWCRIYRGRCCVTAFTGIQVIEESEDHVVHRGRAVEKTGMNSSSGP